MVTRLDLGFFGAPIGVEKINPLGLPFFNSLLLLRSAVVLRFSHYNFLMNEFSLLSLFFCIFLGLIFLLIQVSEYKNSFFNFRDRVFGRIFFLTTGFHGIHVFIGVIFLFLNLVRKFLKVINFFHHSGFEFSILY